MVTDCQFERTAAGLVCRVCGALVESDFAPAKVHRRCHQAAPPAIAEPPRLNANHCRHRGEALTTILCDLCGERGQPMTVYACALHGRCSDRRQHSQVRSCLACADFTA